MTIERQSKSTVMIRAALFIVAAIVASGVAEPTGSVSVDISQFRANNSFLGARVRCSDAEKTCLRFNRVLHAPSGKCFRVGSRGPCLDGAFLLDRPAFETQRRLVGACGDPGRCPGHRFRMAADGRCYSSNEVFGAFCDVRRGTAAWPYLFGGGYECVCEGACDNQGQRYVAQPPAPGECRFPNFRADVTPRFLARLPSGSLHCSPAQLACFAVGLVSFEGSGRCFQPLERGPCPPGQRLVLDKASAARRRSVATRCAPEQPCPPGQVFLAHFQRCLDAAVVHDAICADLHAFTDVFGETVCRFKEETYEVQLKATRDGRCALRYHVRVDGSADPAPADRLRPKCSSFDPLECFDPEDAFDADTIDPDVLMRSLQHA